MNFVVNGAAVSVETHGLARLLDVLREDLGLTGAKEGCGEGECGACAVLLDGELVNSCLVAAAQVEGSQVVTVEGIPEGALQKCFVEKGGAQCGICTPGMIVAAYGFLQSGTAVTDRSVREAIAGNLCRCTGYSKIVEAIEEAARR